MSRVTVAGVVTLVTAAATLLPAGAALSQEQNYPSRPVTLIQTVAAGGATDVEVRLYLQKLTEALHTPFVTDYKVGGGNVIGINYVGRANPDGYTLLVTSSSVGVQAAIDREIGASLKELTPVSLMSKQSYQLVVNAALPVKNIAEYVAYLKAHPGELNFGIAPGAGTFIHLTAEWVHAATNTKVTYINYKGGPPLQQDLLAGRVMATMFNVDTLLPFVKEGKLRSLGVTGRKRSGHMPDVPTMAEQGIPDYDAPFWLGIMAPVKTSPTIITKLSTELAKVARNPETVKKLAEMDEEAVGTSPAEFNQVFNGDIARWSKIIQDRGIKLEQ